MKKESVSPVNNTEYKITVDVIKVINMLFIISIDVYLTPKNLLKISKEEESKGKIKTKLNIILFLKF